MQQPQHIIISRTDNIGDVILTLPMAAIIKQHWPNCKVSFLARDYVADVVAACPDVDHFISWDHLQTLTPAIAKTQLADADCILHVYPNRHIAKLAKQAGIKTRIGTSRRFYHWLFCNKRVNFSRKKASLHEAQLNLALFKPLRLPTKLSLTELTELTHLPKPTTIVDKVQALLEPEKFNLVLHPLTNGNTKEWPLENFAQLIATLPENMNVIISGTSQEQQRLQPLLQQHPHVKSAIGKLSLQEFTNLLAHIDGMVVNSTGPLHIAAALGTRVLGLFPPEKGKDIGRWGPLGQHAIVLEAPLCTACEQRTTPCTCMQNITVHDVKSLIENWF